jgi:hypothetical protein
MFSEMHSGKSALLRFLAAVFVAVAGLAYVGAAAVEPVPYTAKAVLCYFDFSNQQVQEIGRGRTITTDSVLVFRIISDDSTLMNGWEYLEDNSNLNRNDKGKVWGHLQMYPDVAYNDGYTGNFEEIYSLKTKDGLVGLYTGTGSLNGVTATYAGVPGTPESCPADPPLPAALCGPVHDCDPVAGTPLEGVVWLFGGEIEGY